jgi:hypothetical protein
LARSCPTETVLGDQRRQPPQPGSGKCRRRGRLGAALLAIPVAGILHVIGRDLYDGYRGRLKTEPAIGQEEVPMSSPDAPDRADGMARTVDTPAGGPVVRDRRCPTNSVATATAVSPASSIVSPPACLPRVGRARTLQAPSRVRARPAPRDPRLEAEVWATRGGVARPCPPISARMRLNHPDDHADDRSGAVWSDGASNVSRLDPSGAAWVDAEHPSPNRKVLGSNPTPGLHIFSI